MPRSWIYFGLILFVAYLISLDPTDAGHTANNFFGWVGSLASKSIEFVDSLVEGSDPPPTTPTPTGNGTTGAAALTN
ncbi:MAG: hypothetical protein HKN26_09065 [Acidimicrobiales bacterium]|nr:hypothetical protein [Acidimicrobiales bacterium]